MVAQRAMGCRVKNEHGRDDPKQASERAKYNTEYSGKFRSMKTSGNQCASIGSLQGGRKNGGRVSRPLRVPKLYMVALYRPAYNVSSRNVKRACDEPCGLYFDCR